MKQRVADAPNPHHLDGRDFYGDADFADLYCCPTSSTRPRPHTASSANASSPLIFGPGGPFAAEHE
ncbi:hypothetical protein ACIQZB_33100 [Streptomyces sp. NPDC097727]|uniref:hypothetical protein n=1 Tax=Streptomyces sp. NPDC097727 TaxID=3366092 RepID=UPI00380304C3